MQAQSAIFSLLPRWARPYRRALYTALAHEARNSPKLKDETGNMDLSCIDTMYQEIDQIAGIVRDDRLKTGG